MLYRILLVAALSSLTLAALLYLLERDDRELLEREVIRQLDALREQLLEHLEGRWHG